MSTRAPLFISAIAIAIGLLCGCGDSSDSVTTTTTTVQDGTPAFDHFSMRTQTSAWNFPQSQLSLHLETRTTATVIGAAVAANVAPYGMLRGGIGSSTTVVGVDGYISNEPVSDFSPPAVLQETMGFLGAAGQSRHVAKDVDGNLFALAQYGNAQFHLPARCETGVTWRSDMDQSVESVGRAFVYAPIGQIHYRPTIRTIAEELGPDDDAELISRRRAVTTDGTPTDDLNQAAIDYSTAEAYRGAWLNVRRVGSFEVIAQNVQSPQLSEPGCVHVRLRFTYQLVGERPTGLDQTLGLEHFQGGYDLYWKHGVGWLEWSGSETTPSFGNDRMPSGTAQSGNYSLQQYNYAHDQSRFGYSSSGLPIPNTLTYTAVFADGYNAGYTDVSPFSSSYYYGPSPRKSLVDALTTYRASRGCSDAALLSDSGSGRGLLAVIEAAFAEGYALGTTRYDEDYAFIPDATDTLKSGRTQRSSAQLSFNKVPEAFRPSSAFRIGPSLAPTVMADAWPSGREYPNGYDGNGVIVDAWDGEVTSGTHLVRRQVDAAGVEVRGVYIALPILGYTRTRTVSGRVTNSGVVTAGEG